MCFAYDAQGRFFGQEHKVNILKNGQYCWQYSPIGCWGRWILSDGVKPQCLFSDDNYRLYVCVCDGWLSSGKFMLLDLTVGIIPSETSFVYRYSLLKSQMRYRIPLISIKY